MASRNIGTLSVDLVLKVAGFVAGLDAAGRAAKSKSDSIGKAFDFARRNIIKLATGSGLTYFTKQAIDAQDAIRDLSQVTGASTEFLSEIAFAAEQSGISLDTVANSLRKLATTSVAAVQDTGGKAAAAFRQLGIDVQDANGSIKDSEQLYLEVAEAISGYEDGLGKTAIVTATLGKAAAENIPLLNEGAEGIRKMREQAARWGLTVTQESADAADAFKDNLGEIDAASKGLVNQFATAMLPALVEFSDIFVEDIADALAGNKGDIIIWGEAVTHVLAIVLDAFHAAKVTLSTGFKLLGEGIAANAAALVQRVQGNSAEADAILIDFARRADALVDDLANDPEMGKYQQAWEDLRAGITDAGKAAEDAAKAAADLPQLTYIDEGAAAKSREAAASALASLQQLEQQLEQQIVLHEKGAVAAIQYSIAEGELAKTFDEAGKAGKPLEDRLVALTAANEVLRIKTEATNKAIEQQKKIEDDIKAVGESVLTPLQEYEAERKRLADLLGSGLDPEVYDLAIAEAEAAYKKSFDQLTIFTQRASENVQDIIADNLISGFDEGVEGMLKSFARMIQEMLAQAIAADIAKALFGGEGVGSGGGFFGFVRDLFGGGRAAGGPVAAGTAYMVGERGPELFMPGMSGTIVPNTGQPSVNVTQNNYIEGSNIGPEQMVSILDENNKKLKGEFLQELRRGTYS